MILQRRLPLLLGAIGLLQGGSIFITTRSNTVLDASPPATVLFEYDDRNAF